MDYLNASDDEIVLAFDRAPVANGLYHLRRISNNFAVKKGFTLSMQEFDNQHHAWQLCNEQGLRIPQPFRYFTAVGQAGLEDGYILMEFIEGDALDKSPRLLDPDTIDQVILAIQRLHKCTRTTQQNPGPVSGGLARGFPWGDYGATRPFTSLRHLAQCANNRLRSARATASAKPQPLCFSSDECVMVHGDLHPRNILITDRKEVCFVDWATASYYPAVFELAGLLYGTGATDSREYAFLDSVAAGLKGLNDYTREELYSLKMLSYLSHVRSFSDPAEVSQSGSEPDKSTPFAISSTAASANGNSS